MSKNICIVAGARPNFIKVAPVIRAIRNAQKSGVDVEYQLVYTGRKDDPTLESSLFSDLDIQSPDVFLGVDCENMNELTGMVMAQFERYLQDHPTDVVIVVDDLASTMAVAIVTKKQGVQLAHIAAGTRSFDITMPKEINRLVIDGLSDILFTAGISNNSIANKEGAELSKVYMVGNVLIDNIRFLQQRMQRPAVMDEMHLEEGKYMVLTLNRKAIVNNIDEMKSLITVIDSVARKAGVKVVAPLRGKALGFVLAFKAYQDVADHQSGIMVVQPQGYLEFSYLTAHAMGVITDSGNVAEEATFNGVPCVTLNSYTEHMETVTVGTNELVAEDPEKLQNAMEKILNGEWKKAGIPDRWDGRSAERIVQILAE
jgi:UDP-N-acetylglucosamine 2-epimerase (non-hydrolysing)